MKLVKFRVHPCHRRGKAMWRYGELVHAHKNGDASIRPEDWEKDAGWLIVRKGDWIA